MGEVPEPAQPKPKIKSTTAGMRLQDGTYQPITGGSKPGLAEIPLSPGELEALATGKSVITESYRGALADKLAKDKPAADDKQE